MCAKKILLSMGTRPEIIKMAPLFHALKKRGCAPLVLHTGQHTEMATELYSLFEMEPDHELHLEPNERTDLGNLSALLLRRISGICTKIKPSLLCVHGDTSSALMAALAAFYQQCPVAHIEAGLRSHHMYDPFPEEKNRVLIAQLASLHFVPTSRARNHLLAEGIADNSIHMVGNTIVEAAKFGLEHCENIVKTSAFIMDLQGKIAGQKMLLVTVHRRENHGKNLEVITKTLLELLQKYPDMLAVWPLHPNPKVRDTVHHIIAEAPKAIAKRVILKEPFSYPVLLWVMQHSWLLLTDSGGLQEEAVALGKPVFILRETTERPEVIEAGAGKLVPPTRHNILSSLLEIHDNPEMFTRMHHAKNPFGDGFAAERIADILLKESA